MRKQSAPPLIVSLLALMVFAVAITVNAQTVAANSCSQADVQAAVNTVSSGGTVTLPAGTCTWSNFTITKAIHMQGAGAGNTFINGGIQYSPATADVNKVFELNGFTFQGGGSPYFQANAPSSATPITGLKIHDNAFNNSNPRAIILPGAAFGVFYQNTFSGNYISVSSLFGDYWGNLQVPYTFGTPNHAYFEDNTFNSSSTGGWVSENGQSGRLAFRHNNITQSCSSCEVFDMHGEQYTGGWTVSSEIYHNSINVGSSGTYRWIDHRGGQAIIANNTINRAVAFNLTEYMSWGGNGFHANYPVAFNSSESYCSPVDGTSCIEEQVHNSFYFNNIAAGVEQTPSLYASQDSNYIQQNREYWLPTYGLASALPATCTADGNTYYGATDTDVIYKCTTTNTWRVFYQPYTYPHPLRSGSGASPTPPTGLSATVQ